MESAMTDTIDPNSKKSQLLIVQRVTFAVGVGMLCYGMAYSLVYELPSVSDLRLNDSFMFRMDKDASYAGRWAGLGGFLVGMTAFPLPTVVLTTLSSRLRQKS